MDPANIPAKFEVRSFTRSSNNRKGVLKKFGQSLCRVLTSGAALEDIFDGIAGPANVLCPRAGVVPLAWLLDGTSRPLNYPGIIRIS